MVHKGRTLIASFKRSAGFYTGFSDNAKAIREAINAKLRDKVELTVYLHEEKSGAFFELRCQSAHLVTNMLAALTEALDLYGVSEFMTDIKIVDALPHMDTRFWNQVQ